MSLRILPATPDDCPFVARMVCMALHHNPNEQALRHITAVCRSTDVLYSYRHALIAWLLPQETSTHANEPIPVGLCLSYDGARYRELRDTTFPLFTAENPNLDLSNAEDETCAGEYYLDSLAVEPAYRGRGIARELLTRQIQQAQEQGFRRITLLVDPDNPPAQRLYRSIGFQPLADCYCFGQTFWKWIFV